MYYFCIYPLSLRAYELLDCVLSVKDAPQFEIDHSDVHVVCDFTDKYEIPKNESKLKELVLKLQHHKHSSYCKRHSSC